MLIKESKCSFGQPKVEYLGHIIAWNGVATDPRKIKSMTSWSIPKTLKSLKGFLGLIGYTGSLYVTMGGLVNHLLIF